MADSIQITILADNLAMPGLGSEHGFSVWLQVGATVYLLDVGQSGVFAKNAKKLGCDLTKVDTLVLSHGHYDHSGGLPALRALNSHFTAVYHPDAPLIRYSLHPDKPVKFNGMPSAAKSILAALPPERRQLTAQPQCLSATVGVTGEIRRQQPFEDVGGPFYLDKDGSTADMIRDDQALWIKTERGLVIITGCCHAGLINTVTAVQEITGESRLLGIIGGLHLLASSPERMQKTIMAIKSWQPEFVVACHCTGESQQAQLKAALGSTFEAGFAGWQKRL